MASLDEQLQHYFSQVKKKVPNKAQQQVITKAGADQLRDSYFQATKSKHYRYGRDTSHVKHLADAVVADDHDVEGYMTGNSTVGFEKDPINHARIALFLNNGTVHIKGDHFIDMAIQSSKDKVLAAEYAKYKELTGGDPH